MFINIVTVKENKGRYAILDYRFRTVQFRFEITFRLFSSSTSTNTPSLFLKTHHCKQLALNLIMFGNNLLLPSRHTARSRRSVQISHLWKQDEISSESDTPYSPIQKPPHPYIRGHYAKERMLPARLDRKFLSRSGGRLSNALPRFLWDRVVFACFCYCVLLLSYSLAGLGYAGHDYATCNSFNSYTIIKALSAVSTNISQAPAPKAERGLGEERLRWKIGATLSTAFRSVLGSAVSTGASEVTIATPFPTSTDAMVNPQEMYEPLITSFASRTYTANHERNVFGGHDYGDGGRPFAQKTLSQRDGFARMVNNRDANSEKRRDLQLR